MKERYFGNVERRSFVTGGALAILGIASAKLAPLDSLAFGSQQHEDAPNQHNMLVVGEQTVFLSHLPMFQAGQASDSAIDATGTEFTSPHRFQVILEATFTKGGKDVTGVYAADRHAHPKTPIYTLEPLPDDPFVLSHLFTPAAQPQRRSFTATVFRGHLEQGGQRIPGLTRSLVEIARVVHARKFSPRQKKPAQLEYILFGKGPELFLGHAIYAPPDFDQVIAITVGGQELTESDLKRELRVIVPGRRNVVADRLREGQKISARLTTPGDESAGRAIEVQASRQIYFEEGELLVPHTFAPTAEESKTK